jgi:peptidoglycan/LPS O-acetylase OafA/YrhL
MIYRRDIDGLRALAVIPVIFFHANINYFRGGFIGVDVFFVISGYLITSIILSDISENSFTYKKFYERRIRRIAPALYVVMGCCLPFSFFWLGRTDNLDFSKSILSVITFVSNIYFWRSTGYFDTAAEAKPLLHTWSLSIEEQFYILFPAFLIYTLRIGRSLTNRLLFIFLIASLFLTQWGSQNNPSATFFLIPTRGWELCMGAFAALYLFNHKPFENSFITKNIFSFIGLLLIVFSLYFFSFPRPFPSIYALIPTLGATFIILFSNSETISGKILGSSPFVGIGLISYSAYLWHQPLFAFARQRTLHEPTDQLLLSLSIFALVLAFLTWKFVEKPFRNRNIVQISTLYKFAGFGAVIFISFGLTGYLTEGTFFRPVNKIESEIMQNYGLSQKCEGNYPLPAECMTTGKPEVLLWGDSNAMHLAQALTASTPEAKLVQATMSVCGPILDVAPNNNNSKYVEDWSKRCIAFNDSIFAYLKDQSSIKYVILSSAFRQYLNPNWKLLTRDGSKLESGSIAETYFLNTLKKIEEAGKTPIVISPTPQDGRNIGYCILKSVIHNLPSDSCNVNLEIAKQTEPVIYEFLSKIEKSYKVIWLSDAICTENKCQAIIENTPIYADAGHLTPAGSALVGRKLLLQQRISSN